MANVSPSNQPTVHPLVEFRRKWNGCGKSAKESFDYSSFREETAAFLDTLSNLGPCIDMFSQNATDCYCIENLDLTEEEADGTVDYLINYFKLSFSEQRSLVLEWKRYAKNLSLEMLRGVLTSSCTKQVFHGQGKGLSNSSCYLFSEGAHQE
jgi:hypothetical protein